MNIPSLEDNRIKESKESLDKHKQLIRDIKLNDLGI